MRKKTLANMNELWFLVLGLYLSLLGYASGDNAGGCEVAGFTPNMWIALPVNVKDDSTSTTVIQSGAITGKFAITSITPIVDELNIDFTTYFSITADNNEFKITATDEMKNLDSIVPKQQNDFVTGAIKVSLDCVNGASTLNLQIKITDVNEHAPELETAYTFDVASPIMTRTDFTVYGSQIQATDLDFSNQDVTFTIDPDDFDITTKVSDTNSKTYIPVFSAKKVIMVGTQKIYTLTATDSGTDPSSLSSTAQITLQPNADSLEEPTFNQNAFHYNYDTTDTGPVINILDGPITLASSKLDIAKLDLSGDLKDNFDPNLDKATGIVTVTLKTALDTKLSVVSLTLTATTDTSVVASLLINMPALSLQFSSHSYAGNYAPDSNTVSVAPNIELITAGITGTADVTLTGTLSEQFKAVLDPKTNIYNIEVITPLTYAQMKDYSPLEWILTATLDDKSDTASLIITAALETVEFTQSVYTAVYNPDDNTASMPNIVAFTQHILEPTVTIDGSYSDNFEFDLDIDQKNLELKVIKALDADVLNTETTIVLKIVGQDKYELTAYAAVEMTLPKGPKFTKSYYSATYVVSGDNIIPFQEAPAFEGTVDPKDVTIELDNFVDNFEIQYTDAWQIIVKKPLDDTEIRTSDIRITMTAKEAKKTNLGTAVLILDIPPKETPLFSNFMYTTDYPNSGTGPLVFKPTLIFTNVQDQSSVTISLGDEYKDNFEIVYDNNQWQMNILKPLDTVVLISNTELILPLSATQNGNELIGMAVLVLALPSVDGPKFTKNYYKGQYIASGDTSEISLEEAIAVSSIDGELTITLDTYPDNFKIAYDSDKKEYGFLITTPLSKDVLNSNVELVISLETTDSVGTAFATVVLEIDTGVAPEFSQLHYAAQYDSITDQLVLDNPIQISNEKDLTNVDVTIDDANKPNFNINYNSQTSAWELSVKSVPSSNVILTLTATSDVNDKTGTATVVFSIKGLDVPPVFSQSYYTAEYTVKDADTADIINAEPIKISNKDVSKITLSVDADYSKNFNFELDTTNNQWNLKLSAPLTDDILNKYTELVLTVTATDSDTKISGQSTLIITLPPQQVVEDYVSFKLYHYVGQYEVSNPTVTLDNTVEITSNKDISGADVTLTDNSDGSKYFGISPTADGFQIDVLLPVPESVLETTKSFVFTLSAKLDDLEGYATLVINLPGLDSLTLDKTLYNGIYTVEKATIAIEETINIITNTKSSIDTSIVDENDKVSEYFGATNDGKVITITKLKDLPESDITVLTLKIMAAIKDTSVSTTSVLNIRIDKPAEIVVQFDEILYTGKYTDNAGKGSLSMGQIINVVEENIVETDITLALKDDAELNKYFDTGLQNNIVTITLTQDIPQDIIEKNPIITLTLTAESGSTLLSSAIVNIQTSSTDNIAFDTVLYNGEYKVADATLTVEPINIITDTTSEIQTSITDADGKDSEYFGTKITDKLITITKLKDLPESVTADISSLTLTVTAAIKDTSASASSVLNIQIAKPDEVVVNFDKLLYTGEYTEDAGKGLLIFSTFINLEEENILEPDIIVGLNDDADNAKYFNADLTNKIVTITLAETVIPGDVTKNNPVITLTLTATKDSQILASAIITIRIRAASTESIVFQNVLNNGEYTVDSATLTVDPINIVTDTTSEIQTSIIDVDGTESEYFGTTYANKVITITKLKDLPESVTVDISSLILTVKAVIKDTTSSATSVLNIKIVQPNEVIVNFDELLYTAQYTEDAGKGSLKFDTIIHLAEENIAEADITVGLSNVAGNDKYFKADLTNKIVTVTLAEDVIPGDVTQNNPVITLTLTATKDSQILASAIINIKTNAASTESIAFEKVLNSGEYTVDSATLTVDPINIVTDTTSEIQTSVVDENGKESEYFGTAYADKVITVTKLKDLPASVTNDISSLTLTVKAVIKDTSSSATSVLNIKIVKPSGILVQFDDVLYTGEYTESNGKGDIKFANGINLAEENIDESEITVTASNDAVFGRYFRAALQDKVVTINLPLDTIPANIIKANPIITLTLTAKKGSVLLSSAVVNIKTSSGSTETIDFENVLYNGEYTVEDATLTVGAIHIITDTTNEVQTSIIDENGKESEYFGTTYVNKVITVNKLKDLPASVTADISSLTLTVKAVIKDTTTSASSVLDIKIVKSTGIVVQFDELLYTGEYTEDSGKGNLQFSNAINLAEENIAETDITVGVADGEGNAQYFKATLQDKVVTISLTQDTIPEAVTKTNPVITLTLTAEKGSELLSSAVINIKISSASTESIYFENVLNNGEYTVEDATVTVDPIRIITDTTNEIHISLLDEAGVESEYFGTSYADKVITVTKLKDLPETVTADSSSLTLTVKAVIKDTSSSATSVLNIQIVKPQEVVVHFDELLYSGEYTEDAGKGSLTFATVINLAEENIAETDINVGLKDDAGNAQYFKATLQDKVVIITLTQGTIPEAVTKTNPVITLTLTAEKGSELLSSAVINIKINSASTESIYFENVLNNGKYTVEDATVTVDPIKIITDTTNEIEISLLDEAGVESEYFGTSYADKVITVTKLKDLPETVTADSSSLTLTVKAVIKDTSSSATSVLNIQIVKPQEVVVQFDELLYTGEYTENAGKGSLTFATDINLAEENIAETDITVSLKDDEGNAQYFKATLQDKVVTITLTQGTIPEAVTKTNPVITLTLTAEKSSVLLSSAVINIKINSASTESIYFENVLNNGKYTVEDATVTVDPIKIITDTTSEIQISLLDEAGVESEYFGTTYADKVITVTKLKDLPETVTADSSSLTLTVKAVIKDTSSSATSVLNIQIVKPQEVVVQFDKLLYSGEYTEDAGKGSLTFATVINLAEENIAETDITVSLKDDEGNAQYFKATLQDKVVTITLTQGTIPEAVTKTNPVITLTLTAEKGSELLSSAVINIKINSASTESIYFENVLNNGEYTVEDAKVTVDPIKIITDTTNEIQISLLDEAGVESEYFGTSYAGKVITVTKLKDLPATVTADISSLTLTVKAVIKDTSSSATSVLNIQIVKPQEVVVDFDELLYSGEYTENAGKGSLTFATDINLAEVNIAETDIVVGLKDDAGNDKYFKPTLQDKVVTIALAQGIIPAAVIKNNPVITLTLTASKGSDVLSSAIINIKTNSDTTESIDFDNILYSGEYTVESATLNVGPINVITATANEIQTSITDEDGKESEYFGTTISGKVITVTKLKDLPETVTAASSSLTLTLKAAIKGGSGSATSVLNIKIVKPQEVVVHFDELLYTGEYIEDAGKGSLTFATVINLAEENIAETDITVSLKDDAGYSKYFTPTLKNKVVSITLAQAALPDDVTKNNPVITLTLSAMTDSTVLSSAIINIKTESSTDDTGTVSFENILYSGTLTVDDDGKQTMDIPADINVITNKDDQITPSIVEPSALVEYFTCEYKNKVFTVKLKNNLPDNVISDMTVIDLVLQAEIKGTAKTASAVLNILIVTSGQNHDTISFDNVLYDGEYTIKNQKGTLSTDTITLVISDSSIQDNDISISLADGNDFNQYFTISQNKKIVTVALKAGNLPAEVANDNYVITLTLNAAIISTKQTTSSVLNININVDRSTNSVEFSDALYTGTYHVSDTGDTIDYNSISMITTLQDSDVILTVSNGYDQYFTVAYAQSVVTLKLKAAVKPSLLDNMAVLPLPLKATSKSDPSLLSTCVVNFNIDKKSDVTYTVAFTDVLYTAEYTIDKDGVGKLTIDSDIDILTNALEADITPTIANVDGYNQYFKASVSGSKFIIELSETLPQDVISQDVIPLTLNMELKQNKKQASSVLNIKINIDRTETYIDFSDALYTGTYHVSYTGDTIEYSSISMETSQEDSDIVLTVTNGMDQYFTVVYAKSSVSITLTTPVTPAVLNTMTVLPIPLKATSKSDPSLTSTCVVNFNIDKNADVAYTVAFGNVLYTGEYTIDDTGARTLHIDTDIDITTNALTTDVTPSVDNVNDYNKYFKTSISGSKFIIKLSDTSIPDNVISNDILPLTLKMELKQSKQQASAVLNIKINVDRSKNSLEFSDTLYTGNYYISDTGDTIDYNAITIKTSQQDSDIVLTATKGMDKYFDAAYSKSTVTVTLKTPLNSDLLDNMAVVPVTLQAASKSDSSLLSTCVINLNINKKPVVTYTVAFSDALYTAEYTINENGDGTLTIDNNIDILTNALEADITPTIENVDGYDTNFKASTSASKFIIDLSNTLPDDAISNDILPLTLKMELKQNKQQASAVLNIKIIKPQEVVVHFDELLYSGEYTEDAGKGSLTFATVINLAEENIAETDIVVGLKDDAGNNKYFKATLQNKVVTITLAQGTIPETVTKTNPVITLTLTAEQSSVLLSSAVINIKISSTSTETIDFENVLNNGKYTVEDATLAVDPINIITDATSEIQISVLDENGIKSEYFGTTYADKVITVTKLKDLPETVTVDRSSLTLTLEAVIKDTSSSATSVLNIQIVQPQEVVVDFDELLYTGEYTENAGKGSLTFTTVINLAEENIAETDIVVGLKDDAGNDKYFKPTLQDKVVTIALAQGIIPAAVIKNNPVITLTLTASKGSDVLSSAIINIKTNSDTTESIDFDNILYSGDYTVESATLKVDPINVITATVNEIQTTITDEDGKESEYFGTTITGKVITVTKLKDLPESVTADISSLTLTLKAAIKGGSSSATSVLNIKIVKPQEVVVHFDELLYTGQYTEDAGKGSLSFASTINLVEENIAESDITLVLSDDASYFKYFTATLKNKVVSITLAQGVLPDDVTKNNAIITLTLSAEKDSTVLSSAVINIINMNKPSTGYIQFSRPLYNGKYSVKDSGNDVTYDDISLNTDQADSAITITVANEYSEYFNANYENKAVKIQMTKPVPNDVYSTISVIALALSAQSSSESSIFATSVVNLFVDMNSEVTNDTIDFVDPVYTGHYIVDENNNGKLSIEKDIKIITNRLIKDIKCDITDDNGYNKYFKGSLLDTVFSIQLVENLPDEIVNNNNFIALTLKAELPSKQSAVTVLNIQITGSNPNNKALHFSNTLYTGTYQVVDDKATVKYGDMSLVTDYSIDQIILTMTNTEYSNYFAVKLSEKNVILDATNAMPAQVLENLNYVAISLKAEIKDTTISATAVLNLDIVTVDTNTSAIIFSDVLHEAEYSLTDSTFKLEDSIGVITHAIDKEVSTSIISKSGFEEYFTSSYANNMVSITLVKSIPTSNLRNVNYIPLKLKVVNSEQGSATAVLNIKVLGNGNSPIGKSTNTTPYIVSISILSFLIVALVAAVAAYYYFKLRSKDYTDVDEEFWKVRFADNAEKKKKKKKAEGEVRRPTGFVFNHLEEEGDDPYGESSVDPERERRKSVLFDENVEKMQIDTVTDETEKRS